MPRCGAIAPKSPADIETGARDVSGPAGSLQAARRKLSGGEQQMLAIGRAMLARPKLLLLDEPSLGLAPLIVAQVYDAILELRRQASRSSSWSRTCTRALSAADRIYVLSSGIIVMSGKSSDLRAQRL